MDEVAFHKEPSNLVSICVDQVTDGCLSGRIYHKFNQEPIRFCGAEGILMILEQLMDELKCPQASVQTRRFTTANTQRRDLLMSNKEINEPTAYSGQEATFVVHVKYRQNATWQGVVTWAEKKKQKSFRSALELIKLMDSAIEETNQPEHQREAKELENDPVENVRRQQL